MMMNEGLIDYDDNHDNHGLGGAIDITVHLREQCRSGMRLCEIKYDRTLNCQCACPLIIRL
jgi:hypothetical protein